MKFAVIYEKTRTGYSAYVPDLPGCVAGGATLEETREQLRKVLGVIIALNRQRNRESFQKYRTVQREPFQGASWRSLKRRKPTD